MATAKKSPSKTTAPKKERTTARSNAPKTGKTTPAKAQDKKGPGVIGSIVEFLRAASKSKPLSKDALLEKLSKRFTDRDPDSMRKTIGCQLGKRIEKEQGIKLHSSDEGYWAT